MAATTVFLDNFTGSGNLTGHTPDTPLGTYVWAASGNSPILSGGSAMRGPDGYTYTGLYGVPGGEILKAQLMTLNWSLVFTNPNPASDSEYTSFSGGVVIADATVSVQVAYDGSSGQYRALVSTPAGNLQALFAAPSAGTYTLTLTISASGNPSTPMRATLSGFGGAWGSVTKDFGFSWTGGLQYAYIQPRGNMGVSTMEIVAEPDPVPDPPTSLRFNLSSQPGSLNFRVGSGRFVMSSQAASFRMGFGGAMQVTGQPASLQMLMTRRELNTVAAFAQLPVLGLNFGARMSLLAEPAQLQLSATVPGILRAALVAEPGSLAMSGTAGGVGRFALASARPVLTMRGGCVMAFQMQPAVLELDATAGALVRFALASARPQLAMNLDADDVVRFRLTAQAPRFAPSIRAQLVAAVPVLRLAISVAEVLEYEAYATNLTKRRQGQPFEVTRYTGMAFTRILRYRGAYYGLSATGLYLLGGDQDAGEPIPTAWATHLADFDSLKKKTTEALYVSGRLSDTAVATLQAGELASYDYPVVNLRGANAQTYRVKFGRGIKSNFLGFGLADPAGGVMDIATLTDRTPEVSRSI